MGTRMEVMQLESRMDTEDYRKLQGLFKVDSHGNIFQIQKNFKWLHACHLSWTFLTALTVPSWLSWCTHQSINVTAHTLREALVSGGQFQSQRATVSSYITIGGAEVRALTCKNLEDIKEWSQKFSVVILLIRNERTCAAICDVICNHDTCVIVM